MANLITVKQEKQIYWIISHRNETQAEDIV